MPGFLLPAFAQYASPMVAAFRCEQAHIGGKSSTVDAERERAEVVERSRLVPSIVCGVAVALYLLSAVLVGQSAVKAFRHSVIVGVLGFVLLLAGLGVLVAAYQSAAGWASARSRLFSFGVIAFVVTVTNAIVLLAAGILVVALML